MEGYSYTKAKNKAKQLMKQEKNNFRVTYGTKKKRFYFIDLEDRDYGVFDMSLSELIESKDERTAKDKVLSNSFIGTPK